MVVMTCEIDALSKSITDFAVATRRNFDVNNRRARCLSLALGCIIAGVFTTLLTVTYLNLIA